MTKAVNLAAFGSDVVAPTGDAPIYSCRAWVNFNGQGTVAIRASGNVSSITDMGGTGEFRVNFANAMPDVSYCVLYTAGRTSGGNTPAETWTYWGASTGYVQVQSMNSGGTYVDPEYACVAIFR